MDNTTIDILNPLRLYINEIEEYPLLTQEEEIMHGKNLKLIDELSILKRETIIGDWVEILDIDRILLSCNDDNYKEVIYSLMNFFRNKDEYKEYYSKLKTYKRKSDTVNRALTKEEIKKDFNINEDAEILESTELLDQIKKYLIYQNSFDTMYMSNLRLVVSTAKDFPLRFYELLELITSMSALSNLFILIKISLKYSSY